MLLKDAINVTHQENCLEVLKRKQQSEKEQLLASLGIRTSHHCDHCQQQVYEPLTTSLCVKCTQNKSIEQIQTNQLHHILDRLRDEALQSGNLLSNALFASPEPPAHHQRRTPRGRKRSLSCSLDDTNTLEKESDGVDDNDFEEPELFCHITKCNNKYLTDELLVCDICQRGFHSSCCDPSLNYHVAIRYPWFCTVCKIRGSQLYYRCDMNNCRKLYLVCVVCNSPSQEFAILLCDGCDRSFHKWCCSPPIKHVPEGEWFCSNCSVCSQCQQRLSSDDLKSTLTFVSCNQRICFNCLSKQPKRKHPICEVCGREKLPHQCLCKCNGCEEEVHRECCRPGPSFPIWCYECVGQHDRLIYYGESEEYPHKNPMTNAERRESLQEKKKQAGLEDIMDVQVNGSSGDSQRQQTMVEKNDVNKEINVKISIDQGGEHELKDKLEQDNTILRQDHHDDLISLSSDVYRHEELIVEVEEYAKLWNALLKPYI